MNRPTTRPVSRGNAARRAESQPSCTARAVSRGVAATAGAVVALYALTVLGVWGIAIYADLRGDVGNPHYPAQPRSKS